MYLAVIQGDQGLDLLIGHLGPARVPGPRVRGLAQEPGALLV